MAAPDAKLPWTPPFAVNSWLGAVCVLLVAAVACAVLGIVIEKLCYRPLRSRPRLTVLITAIGVSIFLEYAGQFIFGANPQYFPEIVETNVVEKLGPVSLGDLTVTNIQIIVLIVTLVLLFALRM